MFKSCSPVVNNIANDYKQVTTEDFKLLLPYKDNTFTIFPAVPHPVSSLIITSYNVVINIIWGNSQNKKKQLIFL